MKYRTYLKILEIEKDLQRDPSWWMLMRFNKLRQELGVHTSIGSNGRINHEPNLWFRFRNWLTIKIEWRKRTLHYANREQEPNICILRHLL